MSPEQFKKLVLAAPAGVVVDLGTGDGSFVYSGARQNPHKLYIGIDSNSRPLEKISEKIFRKPRKGGAPNVLYVLAPAENLPDDLNGLASEVHVLFPWGSLLRGVLAGETKTLESIHRICRKDATLRIVVTLDHHIDQSEIKRLELPELSENYLRITLVERYKAAGFNTIQNEIVAFAEVSNLGTSWAKKLQQNKNRRVLTWIARAR